VGQRIGSGSWGVGGPQGGASNMDAVQHYAGLAAKSSGKHMKNLGEAGYKYLSSQVPADDITGVLLGTNRRCAATLRGEGGVRGGVVICIQVLGYLCICPASCRSVEIARMEQCPQEVLTCSHSRLMLTGGNWLKATHL